MLKEKLETNHLSFDEVFYERCDKYIALLQQWGKIHNLTASLKTEEIVSNLNLDNLKLINTKNYGQASAINTGIYSASGNIVGYLSADDIFKPKLLTHIVNEFLKNPKVACVYPNYNLINQKGIHIKSIIIPKFSEQVMFENLYCYPGPGAFFYKSHFLKLNGFDSRFRQIPDFDFWVRLINCGQFIKNAWIGCALLNSLWVLFNNRISEIEKITFRQR